MDGGWSCRRSSQGTSSGDALCAATVAQQTHSNRSSQQGSPSGPAAMQLCIRRPGKTFHQADDGVVPPVP